MQEYLKFGISIKRENILKKKPWEIQPELKKERLAIVGENLKQIRNKATSLYDPKEGDGPWSLGCRIYDRSINLLPMLLSDASWFSYVKKDLYFVMFIGKIPIRFYKGTAEAPPHRTLRRKTIERFHQGTLFPEYDNRLWFWRIAVEPDSDYQTLRITIGQYNDEGEARHIYEIPIDEPITTISILGDQKISAIELRKPEVYKRENLPSEGISNEGARKTKIPG